MAVNYKKLHGPALLASGFKIVPIKAGAKDPRTKSWQDIGATPELLESWARSSYYGGLGVLGKTTPGIDIDVQDEIIVHKLTEWIFENIGRAPVRTGNPPRVLIPCAAPSEGLGPDNSAKYEDALGQTHQIEIKAAGQQWVAYGLHPKTKNPYTWTGGELHSADADFLPLLTGEKIKDLFNYFESLIPNGWRLVSAGRTRPPTGSVDITGELTGVEAFENYVPPLNIDADRIVSMLALLDPDLSERDWRTVGMALFHQFEGSDEGKEIFITWSETSINFDLQEIHTRWPTWSPATYRGAPVTCATIVSMYNALVEKTSTDPTRRAKSKKLSEWEKRFALVELTDGTEVHDAGLPVHRVQRRSLRAFKDHNASYVYKFVTPEGDVKVKPMVAAWQASKNTPHYSGYVYRPGASRFCGRPGAYSDDDARYVNNFYFPPHPVTNAGNRNTPFFDFMAHLFPEAVERDWVIKWLARLIQKPSTRSFVTPINITPVTGTGRGLFFEIIRLVVGPQNTHDVSKDDMEGRFNGFLDKCLVAAVQEIRAATGDRKYQAWERLKSMLTDTSANIQQKGVDSYTAPVYANFIMFSNHLDALPIEDLNERRIYAMRGASRPITQAEIDAIKTWRDSALNIAALFHYLKSLPVSDGDFRRAPISETKRQMVQASSGTSGDILTGWLNEEAPKVFEGTFAEESLSHYCRNLEDFDLSRVALARALRDKGYHTKRIRKENGERVYVWYHPAQVDGASRTLKEHYPG